MILPRDRRRRVLQLWAAVRKPARSLLPLPEGLLPRKLATILVLALIVASLEAFDVLGMRVPDYMSARAIAFFRFMTTYGDSAIWLWPSGLAIAALVWLGIGRSRRLDVALGQLTLRLAFFFSAVAMSGLIVTTTKRMIGRVRPLHVDDRAQYHFEPFAWTSKAASFPSGHATTAFAVATALILLVGPKIRPYVIIGAILVAASRVVIGAHFVSDVLAGALFGTLFTLGLARYLAARRVVFTQNPDGALALRGSIAPKTLRKELFRLGKRS